MYANGSAVANQVYCKKGGDFDEFGNVDEAQTNQGKRSDWDRYREWVISRDAFPSSAYIANEWTSMYGRYGNRMLEIRDLLYPEIPLEEDPLREGWQLDLAAELALPAVDDRKIIMYVDEVGNKGKTWFIRKYLTDHKDGQMFSGGRRDDIAHAVDVSKRVFFFNIPKNQMEHFRTEVCEMIKDRLIFSPKYMSCLKRLRTKPHVVVFCNEFPAPGTYSADRLDLRVLEIEEQNIIN